MTEDELIEVVREEMRGLLDPGAHGLLNDCASIAGAPIVTTDMVVEGIDFDRALYPLRYAGYRALAQNLSDVAAGGGKPVAFLWSLAIPPAWSSDDVRELVRGAAVLCKLRSVRLLGGDLSRTTGPFVCAITAFGTGEYLARAGARVGDGVFLTSTVGASAAGLRRLRRGDAPKEPDRFEEWLRGLPELEARAVRAHVKPLPADFSALERRPTAAIDVSDGLAIDAHRLAAASEVALELDALEAAVDPSATLADALGGGEDYALLFTAPSAGGDAIRIGRVVPGAGVFAHGRPLPKQGFDHFGD